MISKEKLVEIMDEVCDYDDRRPNFDEVATHILAAIKEEPVASTGESLACLAGRKGYKRTSSKCIGECNWVVYVATEANDKYEGPFTGDTYQEAESKAREYLNELPDTKGGK